MYAKFSVLNFSTHSSLGRMDIIENYKGLEGRLNIFRNGTDLEVDDSIVECHPEGYLSFEPVARGQMIVECSGFQIYPSTNYVLRVPLSMGFHIITVRMEDIRGEIEEPLLAITILCQVVSLGDDDWLSHQIGKK